MTSTRNKLEKFEYIKKSPLVLEWKKDIFETIKGNWADFFKNQNPITVELGCGRGEYTVGLARVFPNRNHIGVDIKGNRIWKGTKTATDEGLTNVAFLRTQILLIDKFFEEGEVDEIWITFPDPRPKDSDIKRRLVAPRFIRLYEKFLKNGGVLHLKTDNEGFFDYAMEVFTEEKKDILIATKDLYSHPELLKEHYGIQTAFEKEYLSKGVTIKYLRVVLTK